MQYTVADRGDYEEVTLPEWGAATHLVAVEVVYSNRVGVYILEPEGRQGEWSADDEFNFHSDVLALVDGFEDQPDYLIFDPGRDNQSTIER